MKLWSIYNCLCDPTRLRLLHLLQEAGPLCVCHLQQALQEPQVKISKHLGYLRRHGLVEARRRGKWMIYRLPSRPGVALQRNLACLQDCARTEPIFARDLRQLNRQQSCDSAPTTSRTTS